MKMLNMNKIKNVFKPVVPFAKKAAPTVLKVAGIGLVGYGVYDAIQQGPIAKEALEKAEEEKGEELNLKDKVVATAPVLWRPVLCAAGGVGLLCGGYHIDLKKAIKENLELAATASNAKKAYELVKEQYRDYVSSTEEVLAQDPKMLEEIKQTKATKVVNRYNDRSDDYRPSDGKIALTEEIMGANFDISLAGLRDVMTRVNEERLNGLDCNVPYDFFLENVGAPTSEASSLWVFPSGMGNIRAEVIYAKMVDGVPRGVVTFSEDPEVDWKMCEKYAGGRYR